MNNSEKRCNCNHGHSNGGFVLGIIVGALLVFLFATDKGRRILKELSENGIDAIKSLKDLDNLDENVVEDNLERIEKDQTEVARPHRRMFRGIRRRS